VILRKANGKGKHNGTRLQKITAILLREVFSLRRRKHNPAQNELCPSSRKASITSAFAREMGRIQPKMGECRMNTYLAMCPKCMKQEVYYQINNGYKFYCLSCKAEWNFEQIYKLCDSWKAFLTDYKKAIKLQEKAQDRERKASNEAMGKQPLLGFVPGEKS